MEGSGEIPVDFSLGLAPGLLSDVTSMSIGFGSKIPVGSDPLTKVSLMPPL